MKNNSFKDLGISEEILKSLKILQYSEPMEVQKKVIPLILDGKDVIVKSQTGSGKTAAFGIPLCQMSEVEERRPQALILAPTRELALQIKDEISTIGKFRKIRVSAVFGRHPIDLQQRELRQRVHIISGTPGRVLDHLERGNIITDNIKYLVIDEADEMLNMGFIDQVEAILEKLPKDRQTLLFSATMPEKIEAICREHMIEPVRIDIKSSYTTLEKIKQIYYRVSETDKFKLLNSLFQKEKPGSSIIFVNTRDKADEISREMKRMRYSFAMLHGGMSQRERFRTIHAFKKGEVHFLIATDVAARGIHVEDVTHVINYDFPLENENYVHRIGRTGRVSNKGIAISFVTPKDESRLKSLEAYLEYTISSVKYSDEDLKGSNEIKTPSMLKLQPKSDKTSEINEGIQRIRINAGKNKKLRPADVLGALSNIEGLTSEDIGIIDVQNTCTYVEIFHQKSKNVFRNLKELNIKGRNLSIKQIFQKKY
ncbi:MAG: DEAD/DEAH box helicase [Eubacteriaceae bacterium]|nr:DEAD/DEAH box helicase [Eubacteriaceae bacterium]